ncbi:MAG TPA: glycoside hydrolase family 127 protein [Candidatus Aphodomonas merdavium]|nr:glycoside hydrolase family 127 protein [Candidatus Aphodomonas merdavium]
MPAPIAWNRSPLPRNSFAHLPLGAIVLQASAREALLVQRGGDARERLCRAFLLGDTAQQKEELEVLRACPDGAWLEALLCAHGAANEPAFAKAVQERLKCAYDMPPAAGFTAEETARAADVILGALWLYNLTGNRALLSLCAKLGMQGPDWTAVLHTFSQTRAVREAPPQDSFAYWCAHGATLAAALRACGLRALYEGGLKNESAFLTAWKKLMRYHGAAHGLFNASPLLSGANPAHGVAPAVIEELLRSLHTLQWALGVPECGDVAERVVLNALAVARGTQSANQLRPGCGAQAGGLALAASGMWMAARDGFAAFSYGACQVRWRVGEVPVRLEVADGYPHEETVQLRVRARCPVAFRLYLRIPSWCEGAQCAVCGQTPRPAQAGGFCVLERTWQDGDTVALVLPAPPRVEVGFHQSLSVVRGAVTYALPLATEDAWNYALLKGRGLEAMRDAEGPGVYAWVAPVAQWTDFEAMPVSPRVAVDEARRVVLRPYAATQARMAQFPAGITG